MSDIRVVPFESRYQREVQDLFVDGLSHSYMGGISAVASACQNWFINSKLGPDGDMFDIFESYMTESSQKCRMFWVAVDSADKVVGHVGVIMSTYDESDEDMHDPSKGMNENNVCELVRMSVSKVGRGKGIGTMLYSVLEDYAKSKGMKRIVLSTLSEMYLAVGLYKRLGFVLKKETPVPLDKVLPDGNYNSDDEVLVAHFVKDIA